MMRVGWQANILVGSDLWKKSWEGRRGS